MNLLLTAWYYATVKHSENSISKCLKFGTQNKWKRVTPYSALAICLWNRNDCTHSVRLQLQNREWREHLDICMESHAAERALNCFLNLNNKPQHSANSREVICTLHSMPGLSEWQDILAWSIKAQTAFKVRWKVQPPHKAIVLCHQRAQKEKLLLLPENLSLTKAIPPERLFAQFCFYSYCLVIFGWEGINAPWCTGALSNLSTWLLTSLLPIWTLVTFLIKGHRRHWYRGKPYIWQGKVITPDKFKPSLTHEILSEESVWTWGWS